MTAPATHASAPHGIARVVVNLSLDRSFDYRIPDELKSEVAVGSMVTVPFGRGSRDGFVIELPAQSPHQELKWIEAVHGGRELIPPHLVKLSEWMADYYCCPREAAVQALLPAAVRSRNAGHKKRKMVRLLDGPELAQQMSELERRAPKQAAAIKVLLRQGSCPQSWLVREAGVSTAGIAALVKRGLVEVAEEIDERNPFANIKILPTPPLPLTDEQAEALTRIDSSLSADRADVILLFGVTGSGKTEVYLQAIARCLELGKEAIVLVPEIALTPQTTDRFRSRFDAEVSVLHSRLSDGERFDEWTKIRDGRVKIVVGARSALFAPFRNLGLIVVDEEHEPSYKQDRAPRYHARDVAIVRGHMENITVVLGTATPSLETFRNVEDGRYRLAEMSKRIEERELPTMEIVDMGAEALQAGQPQILSRRFIQVARQALEEGEQIMLFLNRRGYATHMQCLKCGYQAECDDCSTTFTYHRLTERLMCHLCGAIRPAPQVCPECNDPNIKYSGLGTEKLESVVRGVLPGARVCRMDSDTMTHKDAYRETLTAFRAGEIDVLVGTQMIAKGLDFPNVTVVGIAFADLSLNLTDFRAGERTFQLLVQVAGRAGRGELPGRVIVQTYTPYHPVLSAAIKQDFHAFYAGEIESRRQIGLPPDSRLILIRLRGPIESMVAATANQLFEYLQPALASRVQMLPPLPSPILKRRNMFYYQIFLTTKQIRAVSRYLKKALGFFKVGQDVAISVDVDAHTLM